MSHSEPSKLSENTPRLNKLLSNIGVIGHNIYKYTPSFQESSITSLSGAAWESSIDLKIGEGLSTKEINRDAPKAAGNYVQQVLETPLGHTRYVHDSYMTASQVVKTASKISFMQTPYWEWAVENEKSLGGQGFIYFVNTFSEVGARNIQLAGREKQDKHYLHDSHYELKVVNAQISSLASFGDDEAVKSLEDRKANILENREEIYRSFSKQANQSQNIKEFTCAAKLLDSVDNSATSGVHFEAVNLLEEKFTGFADESARKPMLQHFVESLTWSNLRGSFESSASKKFAASATQYTVEAATSAVTVATFGLKSVTHLARATSNNIISTLVATQGALPTERVIGSNMKKVTSFGTIKKALPGGYSNQVISWTVNTAVFTISNTLISQLIVPFVRTVAEKSPEIIETIQGEITEFTFHPIETAGGYAKATQETINELGSLAWYGITAPLEVGASAARGIYNVGESSVKFVADSTSYVVEGGESAASSVVETAKNTGEKAIEAMEHAYNKPVEASGEAVKSLGTLANMILKFAKNLGEEAGTETVLTMQYLAKAMMGVTTGSTKVFASLVTDPAKAFKDLLDTMKQYFWPKEFVFDLEDCAHTLFEDSPEELEKVLAAIHDKQSSQTSENATSEGEMLSGIVGADGIVEILGAQ
ncbi:MAG: hypothetical protein RLN62_05325 [Rickettsiales bacterium]